MLLMSLLSLEIDCKQTVPAQFPSEVLITLHDVTRYPVNSRDGSRTHTSVTAQGILSPRQGVLIRPNPS